MKGCAPFEAEPGEPPPPSQQNPFDLIQFALNYGGVQVVAFDKTVKEIRIVQGPPAFTCTSASRTHAASGEVELRGGSCPCGEVHGGPNERCGICGKMVPYHAFPGRGLRQAVLVVYAPSGVGENLKGPPEDRDFFLLIHVPRAAADEFDRQASSRIILAAPVGGL